MFFLILFAFVLKLIFEVQECNYRCLNQRFTNVNINYYLEVQHASLENEEELEEMRKT